MSDPFVFINNDIVQSYANTGTYSDISTFKINGKFDVNSSGMIEVYKSLQVDKNITITGNASVAGLKANNSLGTSGYVLKTNGTTVYWAPVTSLNTLTTTGDTTFGDASNDVMTVNGKANFNHSIAVTKNVTISGNTVS